MTMINLMDGNESNHTELKAPTIPVANTTSLRHVNNAYLEPNLIWHSSSRHPCAASQLSHAGATHTHHARAALSPSSSCSSNSTLVNSRIFCLEDFKVLRFIDKGAQGTVYCARDRITEQCMALKVVSKDGKKEKQIRSLLAEQNTLSLLNGEPWFVSLHASWSDSQNFYFAMEMHPSTLQDVLREGKLQPARAQFYLAEIIIAIKFLHCCGIIHRDIKPANILISRKGHIVLGDFGFVKDFHQVPSLGERTFQPYWPFLRTDVPSPNTLFRAPCQLKFVAKGYCGTPVYMAPEIIVGHPYAFGVDFWAAAVTLFHMLTGRPPWYSDDSRVVKEKVLYNKLEIYEGEVEHDAEDFLRKMLRKLPFKRLRSGYGMESHPYFSNINWHFIAKHAVPIPDDWIPVPQFLYVDFDNFKPIVPGESYDYCENKDPYPEFCWTSLRFRKGVYTEAAGGDAKTADEDHWPEMAEKSNVQPEITQRPRFFKRFMKKLKVIGRRVTRECRVHQSQSFDRTSTSDMSSCSSYNTSRRETGSRLF